ncbi:hypothetical protein [Flavobacterium oreochromis]|uniref:Uncharacterized protein n=1 Tax=Flavobacterium oreochromis TaxID=2906078 RepID=A0ABW8PC89_9FLAO
MNLNIIEKINCNQFEIKGGFIFSITDNCFFIDNKIINNKNCSLRGFYDEKIMIFEEDRFETYIYDFNGLLVKHILEFGITILDRISQHKYLIGINDGDNIFKAIYDFEQFQIVKKFGKIGLNSFNVFSNDFLISKSKEKIGLFNFENEIIWQQSFSDLLPSQETNEISISQEIIEISNVIYFTLNTNNKNICFGLDSETGKVVKQFPNILGDLIQENEYIYFLYYNSITRLNTTNDTIEKWDIQDLLDKEDIGYLYFPRWAVLDGQIYFSQTKGSDIHSGKIGARFGILDFNKRELIFKDQLDPKYGTIGSIKVSKERLYLHTQDSTLHVFEKE